jgi:hypothetical protein
MAVLYMVATKWRVAMLGKHCKFLGKSSLRNW